MPARSPLARPVLIFVVAMLLAIPFPARTTEAGTIRREGPSEFVNGTMDNVSLVSGALMLGLDEALLESWKNMNTSTAPTARAYHAMAYDSANGVAVLFGGWLGNCTLGDTWTYNSTTKEWTNVTTSYGPPARSFHSMVYDRDHGEMIMFGGWSGTGFLNDTWTYNVTWNDWTRMVQPTPPPVRQQHTMSYDSGHDEVVLFGGKNETAFLGDTWTYNLSTNRWMDKSPPEAPAARLCSALAYDSQNGVSVLFGGADYDYLCDTWSYDLGQNRWTDMNSPDPPSARESHALAYDSAHCRVVLFGGYNNSYLQDSWSYDTWANRWTNVTSSNAPTGRAGITMAYDEVAGEMMFFGGCTGWGYSLLNDTWAYNSKIYRPAGNFTSNPHDTTGTAYFGALSWDADVPPATALAFQFRSADTLGNLTGKEFSGPDGTVNTYYEGSGQRIGAANNGTRWFQYRATFGTADNRSTPALRRVDVDYNLLHGLKVLSPAGGENWTGVQTISWNATDPDGDALFFDLYLLHATQRTKSLATGLTGQEWQWDTFGIDNGTYRIKVVARDDNPSIPLKVEAISDQFAVRSPYYPPQDDPPHVTLLSPANGSRPPASTIRLQWRGTDPEGSALVYTVRHLDRPFGMGQPHQNVTTEEYLDLSELSDNTTYFWTVDASDGTNNHTDVPAPVWNFTITLSHSSFNHPPILAEIPPFTINVSEAFTFGLSATDEDSDLLTFYLIQAPGGISLDNITGRLRWTPAASDIGNHTVTVRVSDGRGGHDAQTFTIEVVEVPIPPPRKPQCAITYPANGSKVSGRVSVRGTALNGSLPLTLVQVRIDGGSWQAAAGLDNWTILVETGKSNDGPHRIEARAYDGSLYSETASIDLDYRDPGQTIAVEGPPWCLALLIVLAAAALVVYLIIRRQGRS